MTSAGAEFRSESHVPERLYAVSLIVAFAAFLAVLGLELGGPVSPVGLIIVALLVFWIVVPDNRWASASGGLAVTLAGLLALLVPFMWDMQEGTTLPASVRAHFVWPQILVLVFASRFLSSRSDARVTQFWHSPLSVPAGTASASVMAAVFLGGAMTLAYYRLMPGPANVTDPILRATLTALRGETVIHVLIVLLFCVILAILIDATRIHLGDRLLLRSLAKAKREDRGSVSLAHALSVDGAVIGKATRVLARNLAGTAPRLAALDAFGQAERGVLRGLIALLPLLGFLGTVIGLALAVADLQGAIGPDANPAGLAGVFAGLAVKFETTLLGLLFSVIAGLLLAFLERSEAQASAAAAVLVDILSRDTHAATG